MAKAIRRIRRKETPRLLLPDESAIPEMPIAGFIKYAFDVCEGGNPMVIKRLLLGLPSNVI